MRIALAIPIVIVMVFSAIGATGEASASSNGAVLASDADNLDH